MHIRTLLILLTAVSLGAAERPKLAQARAIRVEAPVASYAVFGTGIRALVGLPGLLDWSEPLALPASYERLAVAPGERYVLGTAGTQLALLGFDGLAAAEIGRLDAGAAVERIVFSPLGTAAALEAAGSYRVVTGLPGTPTLGERLSGSVVALSDDGSATVVREGNTAVFGDVRLDGLVSAAFVPGSSRLVAAISGTLVLVENGALRTLLTAPEAAGVRAVLVSDDGQAAWLATAERLWTVDLAGGTLKAELVEPGSARLHRTRVRGRLLLVDEASGDIQLLSSGAESLQVDALRSPAALERD